MYEIRLNAVTKEKFVKAMNKKLIDRGWNKKDLAEKINRAPSSIYNFVTSDSRPNRFIAADIAKALDMVPADWSGNGES